MLALVCWPPGLFARGVVKDEKGREIFPREEKPNLPGVKDHVEFFDEDLGPGGSYVTRWAADPLTGDDVRDDKFPTGPLIDPSRLPGGGVRVPRAFMPIPIAGNDWATEPPPDPKSLPASSAPTQPAQPPVNAPSAYLAVALQAFDPLFDPMEELWYVNLTIKTDPLPFPRVRLGIARYQPRAREDDVPFEGAEPVRLRISTPVTEWVKPLPGRKATATCRRRADGGTEIVVVVDGPSAIPATDTGIQAKMRVEVIRYKTNGAKQEEVAIETDGNPASCSVWSANEFDESARGMVRPIQGGCSWTCMFIVPGSLDDKGWSHAVTVEETREIKRAEVRPDDSQLTNDTGPNFLARILLTTKS